MSEDSIRGRHRPELVAYLDSFVTAETQAVLPPWLSSLWLFRVPGSVATADSRSYIIRLILLMVAGGIHVSLASIFAIFGQWGLMAINLGSLLWYAMAIAVLRSGRQHLAMFLGFFEAYVHGVVFTLLLGASAGYVFYNFAFVVVAFLAYRTRERKARRGIILAAVFSAVLSIVLAHLFDPQIALNPVELEILLYLNVSGSLLAGVGALSYFSGAAHHAQRELERALVGSENLLLNVLPRSIADRLKHHPGTIADSVPSASVLFADIVGFTPLASQMSSAAVVQLLSELFSTFDRFAERNGVEKIKTIGDAYLAVSGLPEPREDHVEAICEMALEMQAYVQDYSHRTGLSLSLRIGLHTGPVVAGVIGQRKFTYDIWGDTVNIASRMESHGLPGFIQISETVMQRVAGRYDCRERGTITIKGKGEMRTWFLHERTKTVRKPAADGARAER